MNVFNDPVFLGNRPFYAYLVKKKIALKAFTQTIIYTYDTPHSSDLDFGIH